MWLGFEELKRGLSERHLLGYGLSDGMGYWFSLSLSEKERVWDGRE